MAEKIEVLLADDVAETRENVRKLIELEQNIVVIAEAVDGKDVIEKAKKLKPDIILMDINMPKIKGIKATEIINREVPESSIIMMSVQEEQNYLRKAMMVGAREYLIKPFSDDELINVIKQVYELDAKKEQSLLERQGRQEKVVSVFSSKGGVGKTLLATNLAVVLQQQKDLDVVLVDLDLQFGDADVLLDLSPKITIADAVKELASLTPDNIDDYLLSYDNGLHVLNSPLRPEEAEMIGGQEFEALIDILKEKFNYIIIDTPQSFSEPVLTALDNSDLILLIAMLDLSTIKNVKLSLEVMEELDYPKDSIKLILNRYSEKIGINIEDLEKTLGYDVDLKIPSHGEMTVNSINTGQPFVVSKPQSDLARQIIKLANLVTGDENNKAAGKEGWLDKITKLLK
ncbi:response regulator [Halanaerobacter jeridensis]|uniref:Stage 0 sporulation protein A homolog n=1 Tax=Halanaerobacter jeridensis TaxID=706427 RepID=A0A938XT10_9FIRM|nr:pilus assembly protein CpaE [Halanaerobacter jeridensis]